MYSTISRRPKHALYTLFIVAAVATLYYNFFSASWFLSAGDRAIAQMNLSTAEPPQPGSDAYGPRANATILSLVRNEELEELIGSMRQLEQSWNAKYKYPWIFFNEVPFTDEFKRRTQAETDAECRYELIPPEHWDIPPWVNHHELEDALARMKNERVKYADNVSYHQMCRWNSGFFYKHPALDGIKYYWRVEPGVKFFCDINYDVFKYMADHQMTYGFTINLYDNANSVQTLWPETTSFLDAHPEYLNEDNSMTWLTDKTNRPEKNVAANGYSTCHFWSNFEIADLDFWRSDVYNAYFDHLDRTGGFFYERWGDAPVHSVALGLFAENAKIHWFQDIGYEHPPYVNCPASSNCQNCQTNTLTHPWLRSEDCRVNWFKQVCESRRKKGFFLGPEEEEMCKVTRDL